MIAWGAITGIALAANLAVGNALWAWYSFTGLLASGVLLFLAKRFEWVVPDRLLWWVTIPLGLHYLGGSLSGLHAIGGPNGLYYAFPWWDNVVHFLGAAALAVVAAYLLRHTGGRATVVALAVTASITAGVAVEIYEFTHFVWLGTVDQGYYTNTMLDLYYNTLGAVVAAVAYTRTS